MDQAAFTPGPPHSGGLDEGMTPISRLIPQDSSSSGNGMSHSERAPRHLAIQGSGGVPPMNPPAQTRPVYTGGDTGHTGYGGGGNHGDTDVVSEILRDVERGGRDSVYSRPEPHHGQEHRVRFEDTPEYDYNQGAEDSADMFHSRPNPSDTESVTAVGTSSHARGPILVDEASAESTGTNAEDTVFSKGNFFGTILREAQIPLLVAGLLFFAGLSNADDILVRLVPVLFSDGKTGYAGLIVKAVLGGLLFYATQKLLFT